MLCCSIIAILLGQCGAFAAVVKARLFGGADTIGSMLAPFIAGWATARWLVAGGLVAGEFAVAAAAWPVLHALDAPQNFPGAWPLCAAVSALTR